MIEVHGTDQALRRPRGGVGTSPFIRPAAAGGDGFVGPNGAGQVDDDAVILGLAAPTAARRSSHGQPYGALSTPLREVGALLEATALHPGRAAAHDHLLCAGGEQRPPARGRSTSCSSSPA
jgi:ABC-2 type transport system ATP-binding protein